MHFAGELLSQGETGAAEHQITAAARRQPVIIAEFKSPVWADRAVGAEEAAAQIHTQVSLPEFNGPEGTAFGTAGAIVGFTIDAFVRGQLWQTPEPVGQDWFRLRESAGSISLAQSFMNYP